MKRFKNILAGTLAVIMMSQTAYCRPDPETGYDVKNGTVISYVGTDQFILVPAEQNGEKVTKIGEKAFAGLRLENVDIESGIKNIGKSAFEGSTVYNVTLSDTLEKVEENAFANCDVLTNITVVNPSTHFEKNAFANTNYLMFWIDCRTDFGDEQLLADNIYEAKGDTEYSVAYIHDYAFDDASQTYYCVNCGTVVTPDDGRDPDEICDGAPDAWEIFDDVSADAWYAGYVNYAANAGIINGKSEHIFAPDDNITVAEAIKLAACAHAQSSGYYIDGEGENWYDKYVDYAVSQGIIEPHFTSDRTRPATRAEVAYLFSRADVSKYEINDVPLTDIPDVDADTAYYREIQDMYNLGAAVGDADMSFRPNDNIRRSEAAAMIVRIMDFGYRIELPKG